MSYPTDADIIHCTGVFDPRTDAEAVVVDFDGEVSVALWSGGDSLRRVVGAASSRDALRRIQGLARMRRWERRKDVWAGSARLEGPGYSGWLSPRLPR